ncbi:hypothetical protein DB30_05861 [Enhygromyxa salina]|uniref:Uncharacterized protein n=1 Tax=Enhygromyxa salina TaxID=215803 RepID=A0A0C2CVR0_9BACT|nr:hypothetical protein DB30_05861 [Enhygromyxa salina]
MKEQLQPTTLAALAARPVRHQTDQPGRTHVQMTVSLPISSHPGGL